MSSGDFLNPDTDGRPSPVDVHVGSRIRLRRTVLGLSQDRLGEALGLTLQQIQKYERGVNRVGASRLFDLCRVLDVPISFFFDDLPESSAAAHRSRPRSETATSFAESPGAFGEEQMHRREAFELTHAYFRIADAAVRKHLLDLIRSLSSNNGRQEQSIFHEPHAPQGT